MSKGALLPRTTSGIPNANSAAALPPLPLLFGAIVARPARNSGLGNVA